MLAGLFGIFFTARDRPDGADGDGIIGPFPLFDPIARVDGAAVTVGASGQSITIRDRCSPSGIEQQTQQHWQALDACRTTEHAHAADGSNKPKFYVYSMLPYPSGKLHIGHVRNYTINDVMTRQLRMKGYNVLTPMGWDDFSVPTGNATLNNGVAPVVWTCGNIACMKKQIQSMDLTTDWSCGVAACSPGYYRQN